MNSLRSKSDGWNGRRFVFGILRLGSICYVIGMFLSVEARRRSSKSAQIWFVALSTSLMKLSAELIRSNRSKLCISYAHMKNHDFDLEMLKPWFFGFYKSDGLWRTFPHVRLRRRQSLLGISFASVHNAWRLPSLRQQGLTDKPMYWNGVKVGLGNGWSLVQGGSHLVCQGSCGSWLHFVDLAVPYVN